MTAEIPVGSTGDEVQGRLDQISAAWNELPIHERQRLDPPKGNLTGRSRGDRGLRRKLVAAERAGRAAPDYPLLRRLISSSLRRALFNFRDLGIFSERKNEIALTAWGDVFVSAWLSVELEGLDDDR